MGLFGFFFLFVMFIIFAGFFLNLVKKNRGRYLDVSSVSQFYDPVNIIHLMGVSYIYSGLFLFFVVVVVFLFFWVFFCVSVGASSYDCLKLARR